MTILHPAVMASRPTLTSMAILGLLSDGPRSAYELATELPRRAGAVLPRAARSIYDEPRRLVRAGSASARTERTGRRRRTVYAITPKGRRRLAEWLSEPAAPLELESEAVVRLLLASQGSTGDAIAAVLALRTHATSTEEERLGEVRAHLTADRPPDDLHTTALVDRFVLEHAAAVQRWAVWAEAELRNRSSASDPPGEGERVCRET